MEPILVILKKRIPLKPALGGLCSLANYSVAYEETQSNRVSEFRDFVYSMFRKAILLTVIQGKPEYSVDPKMYMQH